MKFHQRKDDYIAAWIAFFLIAAVLAFIIIGGVITGTLKVKHLPGLAILTAMLMAPMLGIIPLCLKIVVNDKKNKLYWWFITFRTIYWSEVKQVGITNAKVSRRTGFVNEDYIFISKRFVENPDELNNIIEVKDKKNFIFIQSRDNIKNAIARYSPIELIEYVDYLK